MMVDRRSAIPSRCRRGYVRAPVITEVLVNLVGDDEQIVLLRHVGHISSRHA